MPWWETSCAQAEIGILLRVEAGRGSDDSVRFNGPRRITELLFYGIVGDTNGERMGLPTPPASSSPGPGSGEKEREDEQEGQGFALRAAKGLTVYALPLSSELLRNSSLVSSTDGVHQDVEERETNDIIQAAEVRETIEAQFLPLPYPSPEEERAAATLKRRRAESLLDDVAERRKKVKKSRGQQISNGDQQCLNRDNGAINQAGNPVFSDDHQAKHLSNRHGREPSYRPVSRSGSTNPSRSRPSTSQKVGNLVDDYGHIASPSHEPQNKEALSKLVMAGMRIYGLQPSKRSSGGRAMSHVHEAETQHAESTEEYKLIYHQTFKGACFALVSFLSYFHHLDRQIFLVVIISILIGPPANDRDETYTIQSSNKKICVM